ncbi:hypothetical protein AEST_27890 [Alishewanella aestuarii B11]|uniref:Uncharacterized protein n=1 Tax=Alishewanella aestuarii B11 TaxID=1197174 RepID=J1QFT3_9ALTE|nr:hypothetical protein AEST_27890 [Alishewanella aestuarii B11]
MAAEEFCITTTPKQITAASITLKAAPMQQGQGQTARQLTKDRGQLLPVTAR